MRIAHRIAHWLGLNTCRPWQKLVWNTILSTYVMDRWGWECVHCGEVTVVRVCEALPGNREER